MTTEALHDTVTTIRSTNKLATWIEVVQVEPGSQAKVLELMQQAAQSLSEQGGFISVNLHRSLNGTHLVNYIQWNDSTGLEAARASLNPIDLTGLVQSIHTDFYEIAHTLDLSPKGVTTIEPDFKGATFINVISTTPQRQGQLLNFVVGNDAKGFSTTPGYLSANFHRGKQGDRVINYSQWVSQADFMRAIEQLLGRSNLTIEEANQAATAGAGGVGQTDFRFYEVVFSRHV